MFSDNSWYGHKKILFSYCKLKQENIFGSLQHGWYSIYDTNPKLAVHFFKSIPHYCWNKDLENKYKKKGIKNVSSIGSPFLYLKKKKIKKKTKKRNVLVFPAHSNESTDQKINYGLLIKNIKKKFNGPYTVCLYYKDLNKKNIAFFIKNKWNVVCAGDRSNINFLYNLYNYLIEHSNIVTTEIQTTLFYSLYLKKKTYLLQGTKYKKINSQVSEHQNKELNFFIKKNIVKKEKNFFFFNKNKGFYVAKLNLGEILTKKELEKKLRNSFFKNFISKIYSFYNEIIFFLKYNILK